MKPVGSGAKTRYNAPQMSVPAGLGVWLALIAFPNVPVHYGFARRADLNKQGGKNTTCI